MSSHTYAVISIVVAVLAILRYLHLKGIFWKTLAVLVSFPNVTDWLIARSKRTPYYPITARDNDQEIYMDRWWLFNAYSKDEHGNAGPARWSWLPSIRVHHIMRADDDGHLHDHPWNARTILLRGWYEEERPLVNGDSLDYVIDIRRPSNEPARSVFFRMTGDTQAVLFNSYHRISEVSPGGVYTLWFTWKYRGTWGFMVDGKKVPWREYLGLDAKP